MNEYLSGAITGGMVGVIAIFAYYSFIEKESQISKAMQHLMQLGFMNYFVGMFGSFACALQLFQGELIFGVVMFVLAIMNFWVFDFSFRYHEISKEREAILE